MLQDAKRGLEKIELIFAPTRQMPKDKTSLKHVFNTTRAGGATRALTRPEFFLHRVLAGTVNAHVCSGGGTQLLPAL